MSAAVNARILSLTVAALMLACGGGGGGGGGTPGTIIIGSGQPGSGTGTIGGTGTNGGSTGSTTGTTGGGGGDVTPVVGGPPPPACNPSSNPPGGTGASSPSVLPIGVPAPSFGLTETAPASPSPWDTTHTTAGVYQFYYICDATTCPGATDSGNPFGSPSMPRVTIPASGTTGFSATVIEVHGNYTGALSGGARLHFDCTQAIPCFIRGVDVASNRPTIKSNVQVFGNYFIVENMLLKGQGVSGKEGKLNFFTGAPSSFVAVRNVESFGSADLSEAAGSGIGVGGGSATTTHSNIVIANSSSHDHGKQGVQRSQGPATMTMNAATRTLTCPTCDFSKTGANFKASEYVSLSGFVNAGNNVDNCVTSAITATSITFAADSAQVSGCLPGVDSFVNETATTAVASDVFDQDAAGMQVDRFADHVWILQSTVYNTSGNGIQVIAGTDANRPFTNHIYIGKNTIHDADAGQVHVKQAEDVVISQNDLSSCHDTPFDLGKGVGYQYGPDRLWIINNTIRNCSWGIYGSSRLNQNGDVYILNNLITNIANQGLYFPFYNPASSFSSAAITITDGNVVSIVNNTLWGNDANILITTGSGTATRIVNNIIGGRTEPQGRDIFYGSSQGPAASHVNNNIFGQGENIGITGSLFSLSQFQANTGLGQNSTAQDPKFLNVATGNFQLATGSPAIDTGDEDYVFSNFINLYGMDIRLDLAGIGRPKNQHTDIGAYEDPANGVVTPPGSCPP